jgi:hypothetical protein
MWTAGAAWLLLLGPLPLLHLLLLLPFLAWALSQAWGALGLLLLLLLQVNRL